MPDEIIPIIIIVLIIGGAVLYLIKSKKSGKKCIGCPDGGCSSTENKGKTLFEKYRKDHPKGECSCGCSDEK